MRPRRSGCGERHPGSGGRQGPPLPAVAVSGPMLPGCFLPQFFRASSAQPFPASRQPRNFRSSSQAFVSVRLCLQMHHGLHKMLVRKGFRCFLAGALTLFPSWTSPVRIRSPALTYGKSIFQLHPLLHPPAKMARVAAAPLIYRPRVRRPLPRGPPAHLSFDGFSFRSSSAHLPRNRSPPHENCGISVVLRKPS